MPCVGGLGWVTYRSLATSTGLQESQRGGEMIPRVRRPGGTGCEAIESLEESGSQEDLGLLGPLIIRGIGRSREQVEADGRVVGR